MTATQHMHKLPYLVALLVCHHLAISRPNSAPLSVGEREGYKKSGDTVPGWILGLGRDMYASMLQFMTYSEIYVLLVRLYPRLSNKYLLDMLVPGGDIARVTTTPAFFVGLAFVAAGTVLRRECYRCLGSNFTFELAIRKDHTLYTEGPYGIVRHPSYTAAAMYVVGHGLCHFGVGSWWVECGLWGTTVGKVVGSVFLLWHVIVVPMLMKRSRTEDEVLKKTFGEQWIRWAQKTPYAMFPYVF
ncbi:hypothetical protein EUX98_g1512 [Antrodiella citrinella]|uniref:Protein-S-isoprenylcysteine O-methyltransferase n=1 Tax=Antrodiella citrinella TaxID=2447956 RepID=A0A4V6S1Y0_9APHY|nr:hypothetical protein EUX98_g1512 [Antrodiella citrinella]